VSPVRTLACAAVVLAAVAVRPGDAAAQSAPFVVVVHRENQVSTISRGDAAAYFLKRSLKWPGGADVRPVNQPGGSPITAAFSVGVLHRAPNVVEAYWQQQIFSGRATPPPERPDDAAVVEYVAANPGAIGYVSPSAVTALVKVVRLVP
jgi:ABC-type phosphate transport system substrate-binding protein